MDTGTILWVLKLLEEGKTEEAMAQLKWHAILGIAHAEFWNVNHPEYVGVNDYQQEGRILRGRAHYRERPKVGIELNLDELDPYQLYEEAPRPRLIE